MMKKAYKIIPVIALIALVLIFTIYFLTREKTYDSSLLTLEQLKQGEEYQFDEITWNISAKEVSSLLPYYLLKDTQKTPVPTNITYYKSRNYYVLDGQSATASFEFHSDELKILKFDFHLDENYEEWFEKQVAGLTQLYGPESDKMENVSEQFNSVGYKWQNDNTTLQIILLTGNNIHPSATIGIGIK